MPFLPPNQQRQSTEGTCQQHLKNIVTTPCENRNSCFPKMWIVFVTRQQKKTAKKWQFSVLIYASSYFHNQSIKLSSTLCWNYSAHYIFAESVMGCTQMV